MNIHYRIGNLFDHLEPVGAGVMIPHVCNDFHVMGSGFVLPLIDRWPIVLKQYENTRPILGTVDYVHAEPTITVANMCAQHGTIRSHTKPIRYLALAKCMDDVGTCCRANNYRIICPLFGADRARGNWDFIEELILELWTGIHVTVYQLPGHTLRAATDD